MGSEMCIRDSPYSAGMECSQWLAIELNPEDDKPLADKRPVKQLKVVGGKIIQASFGK